MQVPTLEARQEGRMTRLGGAVGKSPPPVWWSVLAKCLVPLKFWWSVLPKFGAVAAECTLTVIPSLFTAFFCLFKVYPRVTIEEDGYRQEFFIFVASMTPLEREQMYGAKGHVGVA